MSNHKPFNHKSLIRFNAFFPTGKHLLHIPYALRDLSAKQSSAPAPADDDLQMWETNKDERLPKHGLPPLLRRQRTNLFKT